MISSGDESDAEAISTDMLENIRDKSQSHPIINRRKCATRYVIILTKGNRNGKERYYQLKKWVNVYTRYLRLLLLIFHKNY